MIIKVAKPERKEILGFEGLYLIYSNGKVFSIKSNKFIKPYINIDGYPSVCLFKKKTIQRRIHRLLAVAFIPNPENKPTVNHKNGIKTDYRLTNLEWATRSENELHAYRILNKKPNVFIGEACGGSKIRNDDIPVIRDMLMSGLTQSDIGALFLVNRRTIGHIKLLKRWNHVT